MDFKNRKNIIITVAFIIYSLFVMFLPLQVNDVNISIEYQEQPEGNYVAQLFYDNGNGYNAEDTIVAAIQDNRANLTLQKDLVKTIKTVRLDPIDADTDLVITGIQINGKEMDLQHFSEWIAGVVQLEVRYDESTHMILLDAVESDPQIYFTELFTEELVHATKLLLWKRLLLLLGGFAIAIVFICLKKIIRLISGGIDVIEKALIYVTEHKVAAYFLMTCVIGGTAIIVMFQYLIGKKVFVFIDAIDSLAQIYPNLLYIARAKANGWVQNSYNFTRALGCGEGYVKIDLTNWVSYFGEQNVAYLLGISQFLKIILSGTFFYLFMRVRNVKQWYSIILALGYMYCGHMVIRSAWNSYPNEMVLVAFCLFCLELLFQKKDWRWVPLSFFLFVYHFSMGGYYSVIYIGLLGAYIVFRYFTECKVNWKWLCIGISICVIVIVAYLFISDFALFYAIQANLASDRAQDNIQSMVWGKEAFVAEWNLIPRIFARTVGQATIGIINNNYTGGYWNFLEDPTFYCGIFTLILIPLAFYSMNWKKRIWYALVYVIGMIYSLFPSFRMITNGFSGVTFKLFSLWLIIFMLYTVSQVDWNLLIQKSKAATIICGCTTMILAICIWKLPTWIVCVESEIIKCLVLCIADGLIILWIINQKKTVRLSQGLFVFLACVEVVVLAYPIYNDRLTATADVYEGDTTDAITYLQNIEGEAFYRVDKQYTTVGECDSIAQGYNGTSFYIGGTGTSKNVNAFYENLGLPGTIGDNRQKYGTSAQNEVETLLGIKYVLTEEGNIANYGYVRKNSIGDITIYENENAIPFGFVYEKAIERSEFEKLPMNQRQQVLLKACLVEDGTDILPLITQEELAQVKEKDQLFEKYEIPYESVGDAAFYYNGNPELDSFIIEPNSEEELIAIQVTFDKAAKGYLYYSTQNGETYSIMVEQETESTGQIYETNISNIERIWWVSPSWANLTSLRIAKIPKESYYTHYKECVQDLKSREVLITKYTRDEIEAAEYSEQPGMIYLPVVNNEWYVCLDGELIQPYTINDAFIGIWVDAGKHDIVISHATGEFMDVYRDDLKKLAGCIIIIVVGTIWMKYKKKRGLKNERDIGSRTIT